MSQASFDGYQINHTHLAISGRIEEGEIRKILGEECLTEIVTLTLEDCNSARLNLSNIKARLINLKNIQIVDMELNTVLFEDLAHPSVKKISFKKCKIPFAHLAFEALSNFKKLTYVDVRQAKLSGLNMRALEQHAPNVTILKPTLPKPNFSSSDNGVIRDYPEAPTPPRAKRTKRSHR